MRVGRADRLFGRVLAFSVVAAGVTIMGLAAALAERGPDSWWLVSASFLVGVVAFGATAWLALQRRSLPAPSSAGWAALFEAHPQPIWLTDAATLEILAVNIAATEKYGYDAVEFATLSVLDLHRPDDRGTARSDWARTKRGAAPARHEAVHVSKSGTMFATETMTSSFELDGRRMRMAVIFDVSDRDDALAEIRESEARYQQLFVTAKEGIVTVDTDLAITTANQPAADMLGYSVDELVGRSISDFSSTMATDPTDPDGVDWTEGRVAGERETTLRDRDGTVISVLLNESPLVGDDGQHVGELGMITDLTERRGFEDELAFQAVHDPLTGLPNRLLLVDRLQLALGRTRPDSSVAVVFVNLDGFKNVNGTHGHNGGDQVLTEVARRLSRVVRERDTVARFGGDEFVVVAEGTGLFAERLAGELRHALAAPYTVNATQLTIKASIGVAVGQPGDRPSSLLRSADIALLQAKASGRDRTEFFTETLRATSRQRLAIVSDLHRAVERQEFSLRFQPVISLDSRAIIGAEALIRWEHPRRGVIGPLDFIGVAEETGLIDPIGQWVIEETCRRFARWQSLAPNLTMSLNISARQLTAGSLDRIVRDALDTFGVDPSRLVLEITEGTLMDDVELSVTALNDLHDTGVRISIDDFGTGYSSLSYLSKFCVDELKIDQSFIAGLPDNEYETALVRAVLAIADVLHLSVVAEGVENAAQANTLLELGCHIAQGFLFSYPLTADDFEALLTSRADEPDRLAFAGSEPLA